MSSTISFNKYCSIGSTCRCLTAASVSLNTAICSSMSIDDPKLDRCSSCSRDISVSEKYWAAVNMNSSCQLSLSNSNLIKKKKNTFTYRTECIIFRFKYFNRKLYNIYIPGRQKVESSEPENFWSWKRWPKSKQPFRKLLAWVS